MRSRGVVDERWLRYALLDMQVECFQSDIATWSLEFPECMVKPPKSAIRET